MEFGTLYWLSMNHASGVPTECTSASSVARLAVRYDELNAAWPGPGVCPGAAKAMVYVGCEIFSFSSIATSNGTRS